MTELMGIKIEVLVQLVIAIGVLWKVYQKLNTTKREIVGELKRELAADEAVPPMKMAVQQPLEVKASDPYMRTSEHAAAFGHMERRVVALEFRAHAIELKMDSDKKEIIEAGEERVVALHKRIDAIPHQVIALLKDTKGLIS